MEAGAKRLRMRAGDAALLWVAGKGLEAAFRLSTSVCQTHKAADKFLARCGIALLTSYARLLLYSTGTVL